mgnify:FL=1
MKREVEVNEMECPFCGHKDFLKAKDEIHNDDGSCEGWFHDAWDCTCCGERIELHLGPFVEEAKEFKYYADNGNWDGLLRFCLSEEFDEMNLIFLAKYYLKNKEWEKAKGIAEILLKINPDDFDGQIILQRIKLKDSKIRISVTLNQLIDAFQGCNLDRLHFLDMKKKELVSYAPDLNAIEEVQIKKEIENNSEHFLKIPLQNPKEKPNLMESFIHEIGEHQEQTKVAEALSLAIQKSKPFRNFKEALSNYPKVREQWFGFERNVCQEIALDWICEHNLICRGG